MDTIDTDLVTPGNFLAEWMEDSKVSIEQLSGETDFSVQELKDFLGGGVLVEGMADKLADVTGVPARIWNTYQRGYLKQKNGM